MKKKHQATIIFATLLVFCTIIPAYANSSWHWVTKTPLTVLPWAVGITLLTEITVICKINKITKPIKAATIIILANLASFLAPYAFIGTSPILFEDLNFFELINNHVNKFPFYIVGVAFLILTLVIEIPVVYSFLKNNVSNKKRLLVSIISVNIATTLAVAIIERVFCKGSW